MESCTVELSYPASGQARVRSLFYDEQNKLLWWNEPGASVRGSHRQRSSLLSLRKEQPLPVASLVEVNAGMAATSMPTHSDKALLTRPLGPGRLHPSGHIVVLMLLSSRRCDCGSSTL